MHFSAPTLLAAAALIPSSMAHYCFNKLIVDGNYTGDYEYVRKNTNMNSPVTDVTSNDLRCNVGGLDSGATTSTYKVAAGAEVGFGLDQGIGHPGPLQVYMSKATEGTDASSYDGSGDWFKVYEMGPGEITSAGLQWTADKLENFTFTLPAETPAGQYLMRVEHIGLHGAGSEGGAQFYISCAQLEVTSDSTATPDPTVQIPGVYTAEDPGLLINIYYPVPTNYAMPGPAVWPSNGEAASSGNSTAAPAASSAPAAAASSAPAAVTSAAPVTTSISTQIAAAATSSAAPKPYWTLPVNNGTGNAAPSGFVTATRPLVTSTPQPSAGSGTVKKYGQCGGANWKGATACEAGSKCVEQNAFYFQCV